MFTYKLRASGDDRTTHEHGDLQTAKNEHIRHVILQPLYKKRTKSTPYNTKNQIFLYYMVSFSYFRRA